MGWDWYYPGSLCQAIALHRCGTGDRERTGVHSIQYRRNSGGHSSLCRVNCIGPELKHSGSGRDCSRQASWDGELLRRIRDSTSMWNVPWNSDRLWLRNSCYHWHKWETGYNSHEGSTTKKYQMWGEQLGKFFTSGQITGWMGLWGSLASYGLWEPETPVQIRAAPLSDGGYR